MWGPSQGCIPSPLLVLFHIFAVWLHSTPGQTSPQAPDPNGYCITIGAPNSVCLTLNSLPELRPPLHFLCVWMAHHHSGHDCQKPGSPPRQDLVLLPCYCALNVSQGPPLFSIPTTTACTISPLVFNTSLLTRPTAPAWLLNQHPPHCFFGDLSKPETWLTYQGIPFMFQEKIQASLLASLQSFNSPSHAFHCSQRDPSKCPTKMQEGSYTSEHKY